ncbi:MAG: CPBP family intramembrane metalloprotease [Acidimicrobiia bacterium]|nr:CPBP family intramembrane metalloprotease [Acidimicrobiia bacterium]
MNHSPWAPPFGQEPVGFVKFSPRVAVLAWSASYAIALVASSAILVATGNSELVEGKEPKWFLGVSALALWIPFVCCLYFVSKRFGSRNFAQDYFLRFRIVDLLGVPIGVASQLLLVGLVTWPFRLMYPETFAPELVEKRAKDLFDNASGAWLIVLVVVVVFGAPIVEELVYRGLIQSSLSSRFNGNVSLLITAVWFAGVHLQFVELPGLLAFALVLGFCFQRTKRLGMSIVAHVAFNATGLLLVALL